MPRTPRQPERVEVPALKVHQWLPSWEEVQYDPQEHRSKPDPEFFVFSMSAKRLRALCGIYRRSTGAGTARARDFGIQRRHDDSRSDEIAEFVEHGFPWSALSKARRDSGDFEDLKKPGWLPTAIVVNILKRDDERQGSTVHARDVVEVRDDASIATLVLPEGSQSPDWTLSGIPPIEVIDGQHRLWAFTDESDGSFELPVVAFHGLDVSWQAYLFYTINIKPKKINASLAFDLYPLLRTEDWLERFEGHSVYRETRAQELTEALWSYPQSAWFKRIDMLGDRTGVTQAAWVRSLLATFIKSFEGRGVRIGGLFGAPVGAHQVALGWTRPQQAAFLSLLWQELATAVEATTGLWALKLRSVDGGLANDAAFAGRYTLLNTDQGVRGVLGIANDLCWLGADKLRLFSDSEGIVEDGTSERAISTAVTGFRRRPVGKFLRELSEVLATYDWRTSAAPGLSETVRSSKARFRGGTGYKELRIDLLRHVASSSGQPASLAKEALGLLGL